MDETPINHSHSQLDLVSKQAAPAKSSRQSQTKPKLGRRIEVGRHQKDLVLVEKDQLFFRVSAGRTPKAGCFLGDPSQAHVTKICQAFRSAFNAVWDRLPESDRHCLLDYWDSYHTRALRYRLPPDYPRPLIQLVDKGRWSQAQRLWSKVGIEFTFPLSLVEAGEQVLTFEIARALAEVYRIATGDHWRLAVELIEEPLAEWEKQRQGKVTHAARDKRFDALEKKYLPKYRSEIAGLLRSWGFEKSRP